MTAPPHRQKFDNAMDPLAAQNALRIGVIDSWTPTLTFATAGDLSVIYSNRVGQLVSIGKLRIATFNVTATPTFSSASGNMQITGLPVTAEPSLVTYGPLGSFSNITKAGFTQFNVQVFGSQFTFIGLASGTSASAVTAANISSGVATQLRAQVIFEST